MPIRVKTHIFVGALLRQAQISGAFAYVVSKGDPDAGSVVLRVADLSGGNRLYRPVTAMDGDRLWMESEKMDDMTAHTEIGKLLSYDADLWVIEIEDRAGRHFLTEPVQAQSSKV